MSILRKSRKLLFILLAILLGAILFFVGAYQYHMQWWPFGQGYFAEVDVDEIVPDARQVKLSSIFGNEDLQVRELPFSDQYPTGPFEMLGNKRFLFITKCGEVYFTQINASGDIEITKHADTISKPETSPREESKGDEYDGLVYCRELAGVKDSLLVGNTLYLAYTTWDHEANGARLAVSAFELDQENSELTFRRDIFLTYPAVKEPFLGHQVGGKLVLGADDHTMFLSVGDFSKPDGVQNPDTALGKMIKINLRDFSAEIYATGLRSPSGGLYFDRESNELWETEHGPKGGDEINLIKQGKNYGWPVVSYGTLYEREGMGNYYGNNYNSHENFEKPAFAFLPSVGVGAIAKYPRTGKNEYWEDGFFVAGMADNSLLYMRKEGERLVYAEPVLREYRIRVLKIDKNGRFFMKTDNDQFLWME
ncbi:Glucose / Sorbosone dehydrogenase [Methylobacillus rhizosphaerae]|uniref:Glucose / Sorbosone dehydrogenase n=1 Tax=Methylobacillus rhizosphaerae TaxID=551994 RepID=A0A238ZYD4_9PROT|nr:PQQ-dependent sugar dehydrogenase [Methylobacillus rhizosphaerae]SNR87663.1 Glucose / Sorbosone dehydrogenase [Methylobacillus rhizosphaerae]